MVPCIHVRLCGVGAVLWLQLDCYARTTGWANGEQDSARAVSYHAPPEMCDVCLRALRALSVRKECHLPLKSSFVPVPAYCEY